MIMTKQIAFIICSLISIGFFSYTMKNLIAKFKITKPSFPIDKIGERISLTLLVAFGQSKILRRPVIGMMHAIVWWGFLVVTIGTVEIAIEGFTGMIKPLSILGPVYDVIMASGDISAALILIMCSAFLIRRYIMKVKRFDGIEVDTAEKIDAALSLFFIMFLMKTLAWMNMFYLAGTENPVGSYPISSLFVPMISNWDMETIHSFEHYAWWAHILTVFAFANYLPYSKHFHVFMSVPNVFMSRLEPLTKMKNMPSVTKEVKMMMDPNADPYAAPAEGEAAPARFGVKDIEDVSWTSYVDSLACTHCGRCTDVCPANTTGKKLSPRKILVNLRHRMDEKAPHLSKDGTYDDGKSLVGDDYISNEELWACTTCNACAMECPLNIDQPSLILDMRRYLVMEESSAPQSINMMFTNIENNGAPWAFPAADRMKWADGLTSN